MKRILLFILFTFFITSLSFSQVPECGFDNHHQRKLDQDEEYRKATKEANSIILQHLNSIDNNLENNSNGITRAPVYTIPVVVHVMHLGETVGTGSNISDAQIQLGMDHLNDAFRNVGDYAGGPFFSNAGISSADVEIEFCLAVRDPAGNSTTGINRINTSYSNLDADEVCSPASGSDTQDDCMKALSYWNSTQYMNVWLVNEICTGTIDVGDDSNPSNIYSCGTAGYAYFASAHGQIYDGVVNEASFWGSSSDNSKVHVHEVGHYLNLYHTFQEGCTETDCTTEGDRVCDTPPDAGASSVNCGNSNTANTCSNDASITNSPFSMDVQDIYENYMDYGFQSCQNTFTPGQVTRMRTALTTTRASLLTSTGCTPAAPPVSDFTSSATSGCEGQTITFQDISTNGTSSWSWSFPGGTPSSSSLQNPTVTYSTDGDYNVSFTASNSSGSGNTEIKSNYITIYNNPTPNDYTPNSTNTGSTGSFGLGIFNVSLEGINNSSQATLQDGASYLDRSCSDLAFLDPGTNYTLSIRAGRSGAAEDVKAWIDFNGNGDFSDAGEEVYDKQGLTGISVSETITTAAFPIQNQILVMRVASDFEGQPTPSHNSTPVYGQIEDYGIYFASSGLPVEIISFNAELQNQSVKLNWKTASEINNDFFTIEHSTDGVNFEFLTKVDGSGNTTETINYRTVHKTPSIGTNYYRLSQTDYDGTHKIEGIRAVDFKSDEIVANIQPNPVSKDFVKLNYTSPVEAEVNIEVIDITGRLLIQKNIEVQAGNNLIELPAQDLANGVYFLRTRQAQTIKSIKFVKAD